MYSQLTALLATTLCLQTFAVPTGEHTCTGVIKHPVQVLVNVTEPVTFRSYTWCLRVPPRCSKYTVQLKDRVKLHTEMHNKTITVCCKGYVEMENRCVPACPEGADCPFMKCNRTNHCHCIPGYSGLYCNDACPRGVWGKDCKRPCDCPTGYTCHHLTGDCFVDDRPPRRTTTTTRKPTTTTTTTTPLPTTYGTTLETVKTPVFRFPPPPWVDSTTTNKKTTTRQIKKEEEPMTYEAETKEQTPETVFKQTANKIPLEVEYSTRPQEVTKSTQFDRPPILEFLPSLPNEGQGTTRMIFTEITIPKIPTSTVTTVRKTNKIETTSSIPTTLKMTVPPTVKKVSPLTTQQEQRITNYSPETISTFYNNVGIVNENDQTPFKTRFETTPTDSLKTTFRAVTTIPTFQSSTTRLPTKTEIFAEPVTSTEYTKPSDISSKQTIPPTDYILKQTQTVHENRTVKNAMENEILTKISETPLNKDILKDTTKIPFANASPSETGSASNPILPNTFTKPYFDPSVQVTTRTTGDMEPTNQMITNKPTLNRSGQPNMDAEKSREKVKADILKSPESTVLDKTTTFIRPVDLTRNRNSQVFDFPPLSTVHVASTTEHLTELPWRTRDTPANLATPYATVTPAIPIQTTISSINLHTKIDAPKVQKMTTKLPTTEYSPSVIPFTTVKRVTPATISFSLTAGTNPITTEATPTTAHATETTITTPRIVPSTETTVPTPVITTTTSKPPTTTTRKETRDFPPAASTSNPVTVPTIMKIEETNIATPETTLKSIPKTIMTFPTPVVTYHTDAPVTTLVQSNVPSGSTIGKSILTLDKDQNPNSNPIEIPTSTLAIPAIVEGVLKEFSILKIIKKEDVPLGQDKLKKKLEKIKSKNTHVKEIQQTTLEYDKVAHSTTETSFKSILQAEVYRNKTLLTQTTLGSEKQPVPNFIDLKYISTVIPTAELDNSKMPILGKPNQLWASYDKKNISDGRLKEPEQFDVLEEPIDFSRKDKGVTETSRKTESNTLVYRQSSVDPLRRGMSQEEETNNSLFFNKMKFNMTESVAAGVKASKEEPSHLPMILTLGIALTTLLLLTMTLWVYLKRRRTEDRPFPPCIMAYAVQDPPADSDGFNHPFFCQTFTNTYGEKINRELRELTYDHPKSRQAEPLYAEVRH